MNYALLSKPQVPVQTTAAPLPFNEVGGGGVCWVADIPSLRGEARDGDKGVEVGGSFREGPLEQCSG